MSLAPVYIKSSVRVFFKARDCCHVTFLLGLLAFYVAEKANQTDLGEEMGEQEYSDLPLAVWQPEMETERQLKMPLEGMGRSPVII